MSQKIKNIALEFEKKGIVDILLRATRIRTVILTNLLAGIARGVGFTIGASLVLVLIFRILVLVAKFNIPYIQDIVQDMVDVIATSPAVEKIIAQEKVDSSLE